MTAILEETNMNNDVEALRLHAIAAVDECLSNLGERALVPWGEAADALIDFRNDMVKYDEQE